MEALAQLGGVRSVTTRRGKLGFYEEFSDDLTPALLSFLLDQDPLGSNVKNANGDSTRRCRTGSPIGPATTGGVVLNRVPGLRQ